MYEPPHWVRAQGPPVDHSVVPLSNALPTTITSPIVASQSHLHSPSSISTTAYDEIHRLKAQLLALEQSITQPNDENKDTVDFYELYSALTVKRSGMVEHKPLCSVAHHKKDQHYMLITGYFNLCSTLYKVKFKDFQRSNPSQKARLDASLTEFLYLLGERESPEVVEVVSRFIQERMPKNNIKNSNSFLGTNDSSIEAVTIAEIEKILPSLCIIKLYLDRFYQYIFPYFPFVNKKLFDEKLFTIIRSTDEDSPVSIVIEDKFDLVTLATLLIILRLVHIAQPQQSKEVIFKRNPISPYYISHALTLLSMFKMMRKTKLSLIQALFYLRLYFVYAPEDGDGSELTQSQTLFSMIIQSAYTIGLNRDSSNHPQMNFDKSYANLWRSIWYGILETDRLMSTLSGNICSIQNLNSYKMDFPHLDESDSLMDNAICEEFRRSQNLLKMYYDLANMVANLNSSPRVCDLLELLRNMEVYVQIHYFLGDMTKLSENTTSEEKDVVNFINSKRFLHNFQVYSFKLSVYQALALHYESFPCQDNTKTRQFLTMLMQTTVEVSNISYKFLTNQYGDYVDKNHKFYLNRFIENNFQRAMNTLISFLIRLYHTLDLLTRGIGSERLLPVLTELINQTFRVTSGLNVLMQNTLGTRYYQAFKTSLKFKFFLRSLRKEGYKCIKDTVDFLNAKFQNDPNARIMMLQRIDLKISTKHALTHLDSLNFFVNSSVAYLDSLNTLVSTFDILQDQALANDAVIWDPSFKQVPLCELRGVCPLDDVTLLRGLEVNELIDNRDGAATSLINLDQLLSINASLDFEELFLKSEDVSIDWLSRL